MRVKISIVALLAAAALIAGCGGSSSNNSTHKPSSSKSSGSTESSSKSSGSTESSSSSSGSTSTAGASTTPTTSGTISFADTGNCAQLAAIGEKFEQALTATGKGSKFNLSAAVAAYKSLASAAPSAIRPDVETIAQAFSAFAGALSKSGYKPGATPSASQLAGIEAATKYLTAAHLEGATKAVEAWAVKNCSTT